MVQYVNVSYFLYDYGFGLGALFLVFIAVFWILPYTSGLINTLNRGLIDDVYAQTSYYMFVSTAFYLILTWAIFGVKRMRVRKQ